LECFLDAGAVTHFSVSIKFKNSDFEASAARSLSETKKRTLRRFELEFIPQGKPALRHIHYTTGILTQEHWMSRCKNWTIVDLVKEFNPPNKARLLGLLGDGECGQKDNLLSMGTEDSEV
jgi:hypothetical protein